MSRPVALNKADLSAQLSELKGWTLKEGKLERNFKFKDFTEAFRFMVGVAFVSEKLQHHPEWFNVYNQVRVQLITHDVANSKTPCLTQLDIDLARQMNQLADTET